MNFFESRQTPPGARKKINSLSGSKWSNETGLIPTISVHASKPDEERSEKVFICKLLTYNSIYKYI
jgi:hypothetical protein